MKMEAICNIPENFIREIQYISVYPLSSLSFNENFTNKKPSTEEALFTIDILPDGFLRRIELKQQNRNEYYTVKVQFSLLELSARKRSFFSSHHKKRAYVAVLVSNKEMMVLGNDREPLSLSFEDNILDNATGKDNCTITLYGDTIIRPRPTPLTEPFRVLFFTPPMV